MHVFRFYVLFYINILMNQGEKGGRRTAICLPNWGACPHLGATRPRVGIANLGLDAPSWQYLKYGYSCICKSRPRALTYKCRRGDEAADKIAFYRVKVFLFELF